MAPTAHEAQPPVTEVDDSTTGAMRAIVQDAYGSTEVLHLAEIDAPDIAANEVLVKVQAAGMDRGTWHSLTGKPYLMRIMGFGFRRPKNRVAGLDVAGTVVAVGADVTRFRIGDEVFGISRGAYAEYAAAREDKLAPKPTGLSFEQAAVVPISGGTAIQALRAGRVEAGQRVLIIGASGGVGTYAVQLAKALGAEVTGVCSTAKLDLVRSIGADHVVDYTREDFADGGTAIRPDPRHRWEQPSVASPAGTHSQGNARHRRRGGEGQRDRWLRPAAPCAGSFTVRQPATDHVGLEGTPHPHRSR